jgi:hypothetical protein
MIRESTKPVQGESIRFVFVSESSTISYCTDSFNEFHPLWYVRVYHSTILFSSTFYQFQTQWRWWMIRWTCHIIISPLFHSKITLRTVNFNRISVVSKLMWGKRLTLLYGIIRENKKCSFIDRQFLDTLIDHRTHRTCTRSQSNTKLFSRRNAFLTSSNQIRWLSRKHNMK